MRFKTTPRFDNDYKSLRDEHRRQFHAAIKPDFPPACEAYLNNPGGYVWPASLRVRRMTSARGIWELTWSFSSPDGRATFQFGTDVDGTYLLWRRVGNHSIY